MDGRAGVQPTETKGPVVRDDASSTSTSGKAEELVRFPLTIREVIRRGRRDRDELERLRAEVDELRIRAESAEQLLESVPKPVAAAPRRTGRGETVNGEPAPDETAAAPVAASSHSATAPAANGNGAKNGHSSTNGRVVVPATVRGWAPAAMLPRSRQA